MTPEHDGRTVRTVAIIVTLLVQVGALVWGAATISASVAGLKEVTADLRVTTAQTSSHLQALRERTIENEVRLRLVEESLRRRRIVP